MNQFLNSRRNYFKALEQLFMPFFFVNPVGFNCLGEELTSTTSTFVVLVRNQFRVWNSLEVRKRNFN